MGLGEGFGGNDEEWGGEVGQVSRMIEVELMGRFDVDHETGEG